jgi:peptidoglycan/xylan/chitin deacetylase (PgdA/CDA1 family)
MSALRQLKLATLRGADQLGLFRRVSASRWRQERLLILCYHGVSLHDEHEWSDLHVSQDRLRSRFQVLRDEGCTVLPLGDAVARLRAGRLPERSIAITFDDGNYDFLVKAQPVLQEFQYPATLYLTTYYCTFSRPVFDVASSYFLWKGKGRDLRMPELTGHDRTVRIPNDAIALRAFHAEIIARTRGAEIAATKKDALLAELAAQLDIDWEAFVASRILQLMAPADLKLLDRTLVDVQLHTHRHRVPRNEAGFLREMDDNLAAFERLGVAPEKERHFCYPEGVVDPVFFPWLRSRGIVTATTCYPQLSTKDADPLRLPRVIDSMEMTETEFRGWVSGLSSVIPRRPRNGR